MFPDRSHYPFPPRHLPPAQNGREFLQRLLKSVEPRNICLNGPRLEVFLSDAWPQMLRDLPSLGEVLFVSRNPSAVLGHTGVCQDLEFSINGRNARSPSGAFDMDLLPWHSARVVVMDLGEDVSRAIEFHNCSGEIIHKICLTEHSLSDAFVGWTQAHQRTGKSLRNELIPPHRWRAVQQRHWFGIEEADEVQGNVPSILFARAQERQLPIRLIIGNEGIVHASVMTPGRILPSHEWMFISDDQTGLHFDQSSIGSVIIHHLPEMENCPPVSVLKCFDDHGALVLAVTPPCYCVLPEWNDLLASVISPG